MVATRDREHLLESERVIAPPHDQPALNKLKSLLEESMRSGNDSSPRLAGLSGEVNLPESVTRLMLLMVDELVRGNAVAIVPTSKELTTREAAELLNVSRPFLIKLLDQNEIPFVKTGSHRRIKLTDVLEYKQRRSAQRLQRLGEMTQLNESLGLYDAKEQENK